MCREFSPTEAAIQRPVRGGGQVLDETSTRRNPQLQLPS